MDQIVEFLPDDLNNDFAEDEEFQQTYAIIASRLEASNEQPMIVIDTPIVSQPQLSIPTPKFDGQYEHWPKFKAMFTDIMKRSNVSDAVKLHHLNNALIGSAAGILNASIISSNNFTSAWEILESRYENPRVIIDKHISGLLHMKPVSRESAKNLRDLIEKCKSHVDGLKHMGKPVDGTSNLIINHILVSCLDIETRKLWERTLKAGESPELNATLEFLRKQCEVLEHCLPETTSKSRVPATRVYTTTIAPPTYDCPICNEHHPIFKCPTFLGLSTMAKRGKITQLKRCHNCFGIGHMANQCYSKATCRMCRKKHHTLLHTDEIPSSNPSNTSKPSTSAGKQSSLPAVALNVNSDSMTTVLLSTVLLLITDQYGREHQARALLDSGAQSNFISGRLAQLLRLPSQSVNIPLSGIGGSIGANVRHKVRATIRSRCSSYSTSVEFLILSKPSIDLPRESFNIHNWSIPNHCTLADPSFNTASCIDIILGAEYFYNLLEAGRISLGAGYPTLQATKFGWVVSGNATVSITSSPTICAVATHSSGLEDLMKRFFEIEDLSSSSSWSIEEQACEAFYNQTTARDDEGKYIVRLPRKPEMAGTLGESKSIALRRFLAIERRLQKEPETKKAYIEFMDEYLRLGHMSKVMNPDAPESYYLPHHPVFKADSTTTKCRVVFDASSTTTSGLSLNDTLMTGPTIQEDAFSILLRFRTRIVALTADVAKMYRQVWVHPEDRALQRIIWRSSPDKPIEEYELNTVTYGTDSAPFLAVRSLKQTIDDHAQEFPVAANRFKDFYVDDFVSGDSTSEAAQLLQNQMEHLCKKGGFPIRKWASNEPAVLSDIEEKDLAASPFSSTSNEGALATLGLVWDPSSDTLRFKINIPDASGPITKTKVLSCIARIYDPLGIVDPVKATAKQFMQRIWSLTNEKSQPIGWHKKLPALMQKEWEQFQSQLDQLRNLEIPRVAVGKASSNLQLHLFCDASEKGLRKSNKSPKVARGATYPEWIILQT
ncbi:uncharacterized protein LOC118502469 [Anopheles stephensi]|uniref:uncharacterized protein LOC118502469 n=1 Tax=Anopheles stephensi TaxID=30069 RepID=UPI0016587D85|nr:uncharacterized protein LOC118502469 [Anopheles stephensi]